MKKIILLLPALFLAATSYSQLLISWDVSTIELDVGYLAPYSVAGANLEENVNGGDLSLGSGVNPTTSAAQYGFKISTANEQTTLAGAITQNHYIQFTALAQEGFVLNLSSLDFNGETTATGADDIAVMTSVDGFTSGSQIASLTGRSAVGSGDFDTDASGFVSVIDLLASKYQNLSSITFRIYGWNSSGSSGSTYIRNLGGTNADLTINGTTAASAVPEPSTYPLIFGAATLSYVMYRRCTKRVS
ncbi:MAG: hypothetical protein CMI16_08605 [Opitutaceae bacterium]|nr:hypothetical protein [Opitutaceae bacterium]|tara:strand:+ start:5148 stop:5885 length:738 start_codon:yes stop_codon:yes gene_type:complete